MTTYTNHQQRLLDQGAGIEQVNAARVPVTDRVGYERQGTAYDAGAAGHEAVGRDLAPTPPKPTRAEVAIEAVVALP